MNRSLQIPNLPFLRSRHPSLAEFESLLDYIPQACLLLDLEKQNIVLANAMATELTAFTRTELIEFDPNELLPFLSNHIQDVYTSSKTESYIDTIATRQGQSVEVRVQISSLENDSTWGLLTCEPSRLREQAAAEQKRHANQLTDLYSLVKVSQEHNTERALQMALEAGHQLTGADTLAIYLVPPDKPGLERHLSQDSQDFSLPEFIAPDEVEVYLQPAAWEPGERASNSLFRAARVAKMGYLLTFPLGEEEAFSGILVLSAAQGGIPGDNLEVLKILAAVIISILQNNASFERLLSEQDRMLKKIRLGDLIEEKTQDGVILLSPDLLIQKLNPTAETLLGYAAQEIYGQPVNNVLIGPSNLVPAMQSAQQGVSTPNLGEVHLHRRNGVAFLAHISTIPLLEGEHVEGVLVLIRDLSAHEESEIRHQQLEQRALLGEVTAIFAHEVRNPINNISTGLQLMAVNLPADDPNQEVIGRLLDDCNRLTHLMQSVLTFSRPPENKFKHVVLAELVPTLLDRWRPRLARLQVKHEFKSLVEASTIQGDPRALEQVFSNLIGNAVEAMKVTGGNLTIHIRPSHEDGGRQHIEVNVIDDGPGIPQDIIERIFEPFVTTNRNGTGLGLSIAKRIVSAHKGTITVSSVPGGTVFQVIFPLIKDNEA
ncbi:MAG: PAS domain-containing protein [Anaerolineales bacterium]|nr:PAS domain-containing protein [Anaerolineales bacterium]